MIKNEIKSRRIHNRYILQKLSNIQCQMKSRNQNEEKHILLINPLVIKERTNSYGLNNGNNFGDTTNLGFNDESEKLVIQS